jgi:hypothetical protein
MLDYFGLMRSLDTQSKCEQGNEGADKMRVTDAENWTMVAVRSDGSSRSFESAQVEVGRLGRVESG